MRDPEASRQTALLFLDLAAIHNRDDESDEEARDAMSAVALKRLSEIGSIRLLEDEESGRRTLDIGAAQTGITALVIACIDGWRACSGLDRDVLISEIRQIIDKGFEGEIPDELDS